MRLKQLLDVFAMLLVALTCAAAPAQDLSEPKAADAGQNAIQDITVVKVEQGMEVQIIASAPLSPKTRTLTKPDRLVIDLPNSVAPQPRRQIMVNDPSVRSVRMARRSTTPPSTRVVVDLTSPRDYELKPAGNTLIVKLMAPAAMTAVAQDASASPAPAPQPDAQAAVETSAQPVQTGTVALDLARVDAAARESSATPQQSATRNGTAAHPAAAQPMSDTASPATVPTRTSASSDTPTPANANQDFVIVEPKYEPKPAESGEESTRPTPSRAERSAALMAKNNPVTKNNSSVPTVASVTPVNGNGTRQPAVNMALEQQQRREQEAAQQRPRYTGEPISVNLKDVDLKDFFRLIHEISGLNIVLDPNVKGSLTIVLDDVPWDQALDIVLKNNSLDRQLEGNVLRIATMDTFRKEAEARRLQAEAQALAVDKVTVTRFLSYARAKDAVPTVKKFLSARGEVISDERTNAVIIQDIPSVLPDIDRLLAQLDRKTQEVEIEARVVAATRSFARDIGTQLGFGWGDGTRAIGGALGESPVRLGFDPPPQYLVIGEARRKPVPPGETSTELIPLVPIPLFTDMRVQSPTTGLTFTQATNRYRIDVILTAAESRGLLKILSRPRVVTQNNIQAVVRQGIRVPVVTQAQLGGPPTVSYVDAFLRLQVTPQITVENTIFLNLDVENTTPDFGRQIQGNPTLITQQATTQVLVTDGGTVVIGGVIQTENSVLVSQTPLLGNIPILGNLFKRREVKTATRELIFFITPKIVQT